MLRFEKRDKTPIQLRLLVPAVSVLLGLLVGSVVMLVARVNPLKAYGAIVKGAFGSGYTFSETMVIAVPLILISAGLCLVYRMKFLNIGAKGQYIIGAICGSYLALFGPATLSRPLLLTLMMVFGMIGGALSGNHPCTAQSILERQRGNCYPAAQLHRLVHPVVLYVWHLGHSRVSTFQEFCRQCQLPRILPAPSRLHIGLFFALAAAIVIWFIIRKTRFGYEAMVIGENERAARYAGINVVKTVIIAAAISGGLAGLAGIAHTSAVLRLLQLEINSDYGYTASHWLHGWRGLTHWLPSVSQLALRLPSRLAAIRSRSSCVCLLVSSVSSRVQSCSVCWPRCKTIF